jgi:dethiobiotin synthetase
LAGYFITGTDTGVGKTLIACALLTAFTRRGLRAVGMKPVAAGAYETPAGWRNEDVEALLAASYISALDIQRPDINPYLLVQPVAPHLAARREGIAIDLSVVEQSFLSLRTKADVVIVEGVGGFLVPLNDREDAADLSIRLELPVILVVGIRLGCLNHALLTQEAITARKLRLAGWVANRIDPRMEMIAENVAALRERIRAPLIGEVPFLTAPRPDEVAGLLDVSALLAPQFGFA